MMKLQLLASFSIWAGLAHGGIRRPDVRKEKLAKQFPHLVSVTDRERGACGFEFMSECNAAQKAADWRSHPCFLSERDGPREPVRIRPGGIICLTADHGGHVNDLQGEGRNEAETQGIEVSLHGSECPSLEQFKRYTIAQAPFEIYTTEPGLPVTIPSELREGKYTLLWHWAWGDNHHFTSCMDLIVDATRGKSEQCAGAFEPTTDLQEKPCPRDPNTVPSGYTCDQVQPEVTFSCDDSFTPSQAAPGGGGGSGSVPPSPSTPVPGSPAPSTPPAPATCGDAYCQSISQSSYCKTSQDPPVCHGSDYPCACASDDTIDTFPDGINTNGEDLPEYGNPGEGMPPTCGDPFCRAFDPASYCKMGQVPPVCHGYDTPCGCGSDFENNGDDGLSPEQPVITTTVPVGLCGDQLCQAAAIGSYCKSWKEPPVCSQTDIPCAC